MVLGNLLGAENLAATLDELFGMELTVPPSPGEARSVAAAILQEALAAGGAEGFTQIQRVRLSWRLAGPLQTIGSEITARLPGQTLALEIIPPKSGETASAYADRMADLLRERLRADVTFTRPGGWAITRDVRWFYQRRVRGTSLYSITQAADRTPSEWHRWVARGIDRASRLLGQPR